MQRNYGIDLLRIVLMYMVCMLHILARGGVLDACEIGSLNYKLYWLLEVFSYCAVDGFAIISGYMAVDRPAKYNKLVEMWFQAFFYSFVLTVILTASGISSGFGKSDMIRYALPVTSGRIWYFTAFFALFLAMPILNKFIFSLDAASSGKMFFILFFLFSIMGSAADPFETALGYSALWLIVLYCMGLLAKRIELFETRKTSTLIILWMLCIGISWGMKVFLHISRLVTYISPTILVSGMIMVVIFSRLKLKGNIIAKLSPLAFGVYLFQLSPVIWNNVLKDTFVSVVDKNIVIGMGYVILAAFIVLVLGLFADFVRSKFFELIRIHTVSKKIVCIIDELLEKFMNLSIMK